MGGWPAARDIQIDVLCLRRLRRDEGFLFSWWQIISGESFVWLVVNYVLCYFAVLMFFPL